MKSETEIFLLKLKELMEKLERYREERTKVEIRFGITLARIDSIARSLALVNHPIPADELPPELRVITRGTIADSIEKILLDNGAMRRKQIAEILVKAGRIASNNARVVVFNTIQRDKEKRFKVREDKMIDLTYGETEKAVRRSRLEVR
jgi:hypothetical protein